jgi:hypothetical protein
MILCKAVLSRSNLCTRPQHSRKLRSVEEASIQGVSRSTLWPDITFSSSLLQHGCKVLARLRIGEVRIKRKDGQVFVIRPESGKGFFPFLEIWSIFSFSDLEAGRISRIILGFVIFLHQGIDRDIER